MKRLSAKDDTSTATTNVNITSGSITGITDLAVADGGTGASTLTGIVKGNGTSAFTAVAAPSGAIVGTTDTQTLTGKTISGGSNTLSAIDNASLTNSTVTVGSTSISLGGTAATLAGVTLTTPVLGVATATSINKVALTAPATAATLTIANNKTLTVNNSITLAGTDSTTMTFPGATDTIAGLAAVQTITGAWTFGAAGNVGKLKIAGTTSGTTILDATAAASGTLTLPAATDTLVGKATTDTLTNKTLTSPVLTTPALGTPASGVMTNVTGLPNSALATGAGQPGGAWTSYTPTLTYVTTGNGTLVASYTQIGKTIMGKGVFTMGTTSSIAGVVTISLPVTASSNAMVVSSSVIGAGTVVDAATFVYPLDVMYLSTTTMNLNIRITVAGANPVYQDINTNRRVSNTVPIAFGTGDQFNWQIMYEAA